MSVIQNRPASTGLPGRRERASSSRNCSAGGGATGHARVLGQRPHLPRRLVCASCTGEVASITAVVKTQGGDTKLAGQLQPYYEATGPVRQDLGGRGAPPLVTQIADGENGGVMMNEFPPKHIGVVRECPGTRTRP